MHLWNRCRSLKPFNRRTGSKHNIAIRINHEALSIRVVVLENRVITCVALIIKLFDSRRNLYVAG